MHNLGQKKVIISRDMLAKIAAEYPAVFDKLIEAVKTK
jgi:ribosomal protein L20